MTGFLQIDSNRDQVLLTRFPLGFDIRKTQKLADGVLLKQTIYKDRGIKYLKVFSPTLSPTDKQYLLLTSFTFKK